MTRNPLDRFVVGLLVFGLLLDPAFATVASPHSLAPPAPVDSGACRKQAITAALVSAEFAKPFSVGAAIAVMGALAAALPGHLHAAHAPLIALAFIAPRRKANMTTEEVVNNIRDLLRRYPKIISLLPPGQIHFLISIGAQENPQRSKTAEDLGVTRERVRQKGQYFFLVEPPGTPVGPVVDVSLDEYAGTPLGDLRLRREDRRILETDGILSVGKIMKSWFDPRHPLPPVSYHGYFHVLKGLASFGLHHIEGRGWVRDAYAPRLPADLLGPVRFLFLLLLIPAIATLSWAQAAPSQRVKPLPKTSPAALVRQPDEARSDPGPKSLQQIDGFITVIGLAILPGFWRRRDSDADPQESGDQEKIALLLELMHLYPAAVETFTVHEIHFLEIILGKNFRDFKDLAQQSKIPYSQLNQRFDHLFMKYRDLDAVETLAVDEGIVDALARNDIHFVSSLLRAWPKGPVGLSGIGAKGQLALILALEREGLKYDYVAERWISNIFGGATTLSQEPSLLTAIRTVAERLETALPRRMPVMKRWLMDWILAHSGTSIPDISREAELSAARIFWHLRALHAYLKDQEHRIRDRQHDERLILPAA